MVLEMLWLHWVTHNDLPEKEWKWLDSDPIIIIDPREGFLWFWTTFIFSTKNYFVFIFFEKPPSGGTGDQKFNTFFRLATDLKAAATLSPDGRICAAACTPCQCQHRVTRACRGPLWLGRSKIMPRAGVVSTQRSQTQPRTDDLSSWQDKSSSRKAESQ